MHIFLLVKFLPSCRARKNEAKKWFSRLGKISRKINLAVNFQILYIWLPISGKSSSGKISSMGERQTVANVLEAAPPFQGREVVIKKGSHVANQIVEEVLDAHGHFSGDYDLIVQNISFSSRIPLEAQLFDFCKKNLHYVIEEGAYQSTRSPAGIIQLGSIEGVGCDCKHYAGYIAGVLDAMNRKAGKRVYDWSYRFASYDKNPEPGHVFVVLEKKDGDLVWIDPVLGRLDQRWPWPWSFKDKKPTMIARLSGIGLSKQNLPDYLYVDKKPAVGCNDCAKKRMGLTTSATGAIIMKVAPDLAVIPVVGWIAAGAGEVIGAALEIFGNKSTLSSGQRWLIQDYQYYVLGEQVRGLKHESDSYMAACNAWFSLVLGVPIASENDILALNGNNNNAGSAASWKPSKIPYGQRADKYMGQGIASQYNVPYASALQAAQLIDNLPMNQVKGGWADALAAPTVAIVGTTQQLPYPYSLANETSITAPPASANAAAPSGGAPAVPVSSNPFQNIVSWAQANPWIAGGIAVGAVGLIYLATKKHKRKK